MNPIKLKYTILNEFTNEIYKPGIRWFISKIEQANSKYRFKYVKNWMQSSLFLNEFPIMETNFAFELV